MWRKSGQLIPQRYERKELVLNDRLPVLSSRREPQGSLPKDRGDPGKSENVNRDEYASLVEEVKIIRDRNKRLEIELDEYASLVEEVKIIRDRNKRLEIELEKQSERIKQLQMVNDMYTLSPKNDQFEDDDENDKCEDYDQSFEEGDPQSEREETLISTLLNCVTTKDLLHSENERMQQEINDLNATIKNEREEYYALLEKTSQLEIQNAEMYEQLSSMDKTIR